MSSVFSENSIEKIKKIKKVFLWIAVCILIGEVVAGAIIILTQKFDPMVGRLMITFALCAVAMFIGVNNFSRMENNDMVVQGFATVSLIMNIVWLVLSILVIWEVIPYIEFANSGSYYFSTRLTVAAKIMMMAINLAISCFLISNVWAIKETIKPVKPLKVTALLCELYCGIYAVVVILGDMQTVTDARWYALAGLAGFAFIVMAIAAVIVSKSGAKKAAAEGVGASKEEVQATIQEMVEKEVQERLKAEREKAERDAMPPLQAEDMPPTVARDNEVVVPSEEPAEVIEPVVPEQPVNTETPVVPEKLADVVENSNPTENNAGQNDSGFEGFSNNGTN